MVGTECDGAAFQRHFKKAWQVSCVRVRVQLCHFLMSFREGPHHKLFLQEKNLFQNSVRWQTLL